MEMGVGFGGVVVTGLMRVRGSSLSHISLAACPQVQDIGFFQILGKHGKTLMLAGEHCGGAISNAEDPMNTPKKQRYEAGGVSCATRRSCYVACPNPPRIIVHGGLYSPDPCEFQRVFGGIELRLHC